MDPLTVLEIEEVRKVLKALIEEKVEDWIHGVTMSGIDGTIRKETLHSLMETGFSYMDKIINIAGGLLKIEGKEEITIELLQRAIELHAQKIDISYPKSK